MRYGVRKGGRLWAGERGEDELLLPGGATLLLSEGAVSTPTPVRRLREVGRGVTLEGKFRLERELGSGGMGTVFRAIDEALGRPVAIKFLRCDDEEARARFHKEAQAMASVRHENVVQIFGFGREGDVDFFVMEYIEGETVESREIACFSRGRPLPLGEVVRLLDQACAGLAAVHDLGMVHRDVKPSNLMVEALSERVLLTDFGLGRGPKAPNEPRAVRAIGGTPGYMAPEAIEGRELEGWEEVLVDVYALGVTAYELLTGRLPFSAENWAKLMHLQLTEECSPPSSLRPEIPPALDELVLGCLRRDPTERFQWCHEIRGALQPLLLDAAPSPTSPRPLRSSHRTPAEEPGGPRVIVISDDVELRSMAYSVSQEVLPGCCYRASRSPLSALPMIRACPPVAVVASLHSPELNGFELAATLRGEPSLRDVALILTADEASDSDRALLEQMGRVVIVEEPPSRSSLAFALARATKERPPSPSRGASAADTL